MNITQRRILWSYHGMVAEVSKKSGMSHSAVSRWFSGRTRVASQRIVDAADEVYSARFNRGRPLDKGARKKQQRAH